MNIRDREFSRLSTDQLYAILRLRIDVFVVEQECAYPELDDRDQESGTRHISIEDDAGVQAYIRLLDDGAVRRIGRVVTRTDARSNGLARALVDYTVEHSDGPWVLDAQSYLVAWYRDQGFTVDGEGFVEDGIPHVPMRRED